MKEGPAGRLASLRPDIKQRWTALLRVETTRPSPSAVLFSRELMLCKLDDTLSRLTASLGPGGRRRQRMPGPLGTTKASCQCGIHLLMSYYQAGEAALKESLAQDSHLVRAKVLLAFRRLASEEIKALTGVCRMRGGDHCSLSRARAGLASASRPA
jgi:hypothetical protein